MNCPMCNQKFLKELNSNYAFYCKCCNIYYCDNDYFSIYDRNKYWYNNIFYNKNQLERIIKMKAFL